MGLSSRQGDQGLSPRSCDAKSDAQAADTNHTAGFPFGCPDWRSLAVPEQISGIQSSKDHNKEQL